jgi:hypothetical protein
MPGWNSRSFPNAITSWAGDNLTVRERSMMGMMNEITDKPEWDRKVFDETIVAKWKGEALAKNDFTEQMFNYVSGDHPVPDWLDIHTFRAVCSGTS